MGDDVRLTNGQNIAGTNEQNIAIQHEQVNIHIRISVRFVVGDTSCAFQELFLSFIVDQCPVHGFDFSENILLHRPSTIPRNRRMANSGNGTNKSIRVGSKLVFLREIFGKIDSNMLVVCKQRTHY